MSIQLTPPSSTPPSPTKKVSFSPETKNYEGKRSVKPLDTADNILNFVAGPTGLVGDVTLGCTIQ